MPQNSPVDRAPGSLARSAVGGNRQTGTLKPVPAQRMLEEQGYVVVCGWKRLPLGAVINIGVMHKESEPFQAKAVVIGGATEEDWNQQLEKYAIPSDPVPAGVFFHKVVAE